MQKLILFALLLGLSACTNKNSQVSEPSVPTQIEQNWFAGVGQFNGNIDFGVLTSNQNKISTITIKNIGDSSLIGPATISGTDFTLVYQNCNSLMVDKSCTVKLSFNSAGKANGTYNSILKLGESEANISAGINLVPISDNLQILVNSLPVSNNIDFGVVKYNQNILKTLLIKNNNESGELSANALLSGSNFTINYDNCSGKPVKAKQSCQIKLSLSGVGKNGLIQESFSFGPLNLSVSADVKNLETLSAAASDVKLVMGSQSYNPGAVDMGTWNQSKTQNISLYLKNFGTEASILGPVTVAPSVQLVYNGCETLSTLAPNGSCLIKVTTIPQSSGTFSGAISAKGNVYALQALVRNPGDKINCSLDNSDSAFITWNGSSYSQCVIETCNSSYHLNGNTCESDTAICSIDNGSGIKTWSNGNWGSCLVNACNSSFHISGNACISNTQSCTIDNAVAIETWTGSTWGSCTVQSCIGDYHKVGNACILNTQTCNIDNGVGSQTWNVNDWNTCLVQSCNSNFHQFENTCISNIRSCNINNSIATESWNGSSWGSCTVQSCLVNHHQVGNTCVFNTQSCPIDNGLGSQNWNGSDWNSCVVQSCITNFHIQGNSCVPDTQSISITQPITGQGTISGPSTVNYGASATFTYNPGPGFKINAWGGDCASVGVGNSCVLSNIIANKTVSLSVGCKSGYNVSGNACVPNLSLSSGTCTSNPLFAYSSCNVSVSGGAGSVTLSTNYGTVNSSSKQYIPNCLNNSGAATVTATDSDNNTSSINLTVTCVYSGCSEIKAKGYGLTGGNFWVDMDGYASSNPMSVYCDMTNDSYTEIFDLTRQTSLSSTDVLNKLNIFSLSPLSSGQVIKDGNGAYWKNTSGIEGLSYALNKYPVGSVKIRVNRVSETNANQGGFSVHNINKTGCASNWSAGNSCTSDLKMGSTQPSLNLFNYVDGTVGNANWSFSGLTGNTVYSGPQLLDHTLNDVNSSGVFFTTYGRTEGSPAGQSLYHITYLKFKDIYYHHPISCADAKAKGALNSDNTTGSGIYVLDDDGFELKNPPANVYCDMSGVGLPLTSSCLDAKRFGQKNDANNTSSGYFSLDLDGIGTGSSSTQSIYCDQESLGGGWALITNSTTTSTSYPTNTLLSTANNFNLQPLFPSSITNSNKMVKVKGGVMGEYVYESSNQWKSVKDNTIKLVANGTGTVSYLWYVNDIYSIAYPLIGNPNHGGSWCNSSNNILFYMVTVPNNGIGIFSGSNAFEGGCNSNVYYSDNFNWQVFSK